MSCIDKRALREAAEKGRMCANGIAVDNAKHSSGS